MPNHDFKCTECGWVLRDQYRSVDVGAQADPPICFNCDLPMQWVPAIGRIDLLSDGSGKFTTYDGQNNPITVESFAQMRQIERDSEQQFRNGEGQPLRFRALHQSRSNRLDNTFGPDPAERPTAEGKRKFGLRGATKMIDATDGATPEHSYGPGVHDGNTSALPEKF